MSQTTITIQNETLERFNRLKSEATEENMPEQSADLFLQSLMDTWDAVDSDTDTPVDYGEIDALEYDDVVSACGKAIRDELPDHTFR